LQQQAQNLLGLLKRTASLSMNDLTMNDLSYTLFVGRMHMACRLSCVARDQKELIQFLEQWMATGAASQVYTAEIQESRIRENISLKKFGNYCIQECRNATDAASYLENLAAIAELYVKGYSLDYRALFSQDSRRIPLPTYPFARESYWVDTSGAVRTQATPVVTIPRPLSHPNTSNQDDIATEAVEQKWLFSIEQQPTNGHSPHVVSMAAEEKIELFLKQETALQLHRPIEEISTNMSYFDLGLSSLAITTLVHKINKLLNESLSPTTLFEQKDIRSLAAYLAATYPVKLDALTVIKQESGQTHSEEQQKIHPANHALLPRTEDSSVYLEPSLHEQTDESAPRAEGNGMRVSEEVWWQEMSHNNGYEKVTF